MEGEAYFEVQNNPQKPFIIEVDDVEVKALGTSFNINAANEELVEEVVASGKVGVRLGTSEYG